MNQPSSLEACARGAGFLLIFMLFVVDASACSSVACGSGTRNIGGKCVPATTSRRCGAGTTDQMGVCVAPEPITCGGGTMLTDGMCVPTGLPACGLGTVARGGECVQAALQRMRLPFEAGYRTRITQGAHGSFSHNGSAVHAIDFDVPEGTMVVAASAGTVVGVKEDSNMGCGEVSCAPQANYVVVDHGDGTFARYFHLQQNGALVSVGDYVCVGEPIGRSGNTGFQRQRTYTSTCSTSPDTRCRCTSSASAT